MFTYQISAGMDHAVRSFDVGVVSAGQPSTPEKIQEAAQRSDANDRHAQYLDGVLRILSRLLGVPNDEQMRAHAHDAGRSLLNVSSGEYRDLWRDLDAALALCRRDSITDAADPATASEELRDGMLQLPE